MLSTRRGKGGEEQNATPALKQLAICLMSLSPLFPDSLNTHTCTCTLTRPKCIWHVRGVLGPLPTFHLIFTTLQGKFMRFVSEKIGLERFFKIKLKLTKHPVGKAGVRVWGQHREKKQRWGKVLQVSKRRDHTDRSASRLPQRGQRGGSPSRV